MKIFPTNFNPSSSSGPNSFTKGLLLNLSERHNIQTSSSFSDSDVEFAIIESRLKKTLPRVVRLDGIYFNIDQDFSLLNSTIKETYLSSDVAIFQSDFNKRLTESWFGSHKNGIVVKNGANISAISKVEKADTSSTFGDRKIWMSASSWRPHKRLNSNIEYFVNNSDKDDIMLIAGSGVVKEDFRNYENLVNKRIFYLGHVSWESLISLYKSASTFIHLAFLDHCPNVVVDAAACGADIVCSSSGGTNEIEAASMTIVEDLDWNFKPIQLYNPPKLKFENKVKISKKFVYNLDKAADMYAKSIRSLV
tara:strand:+ start:3169 stop:4089 length:921 start_codon:yes stop_codon:yes gene_type:complete